MYQVILGTGLQHEPMTCALLELRVLPESCIFMFYCLTIFQSSGTFNQVPLPISRKIHMPGTNVSYAYKRHILINISCLQIQYLLGLLFRIWI
jgi:hypothetical protein